MEPNQANSFPSTIWTDVANACGDTTGAVPMLESLLQRYYRPLQNHLVFRFRVSEDDAAEWLQSFILQRVLLGELLRRAAKERGKFRTFLLNSLDNFVISELRRKTTLKRSPQGGLLSLEEFDDCQELSNHASPERSLTTDWAREILVQALERMEAECELKQDRNRWGVFKARLLDPELDGIPAPSYEELILRFGFRSPAEASNTLITAKRQFQRILREVIGEYAGGPPEVEEEIRELKRALGGSL